MLKVTEHRQGQQCKQCLIRIQIVDNRERIHHQRAENVLEKIINYKDIYEFVICMKVIFQ